MKKSSRKNRVKVSLISTVYNEENSIGAFLESIARQTRRPDEIVITDGGSTDRTQAIVRAYPRRRAPIRLLVVHGNRSVGRNAAIRAARFPLVAATDAGCLVDREWLKRIVEPFEKDSSVDVVAGWFQPWVKTEFEAAAGMTMVPALTTINPETLLPSTRSVAFKKSVWKEVGGFDERYSHNEDAPFMIALRKRGFTFCFQPRAVVLWRQRDSLRGLWNQCYRYAYGDGEALSLGGHYAFFALLGIFSLVLLALASTHTCWWYLVWVVLGIAYLYSPLVLHKDRKRFTSFAYLLPATRLTIIASTVVGFVHGFIHRWFKA